MKKQIQLLQLIPIFFSIAGFSQIATSIANGNWTNPTTWNCTCIPLPGATVTINHNVILNTSFAYSTGSITINAGGSLVTDVNGRDMWVNGGGFSNNGNVDVHFLLTSIGSFSNSGTLTTRAFSNFINFTNSGVIQNLDSMTNHAIVINTGSFLNIDSITNNGTFTNNGICTYNQFTNNGTYSNNGSLTFTDITNNGLLNNFITIHGLHSVWNKGRINNNSNSFFTLDKSLLNRKPITGNASIKNDGRVIILDSYYNYDTIKGNGSISVQDSSVNYGYMLETFDFCDYTPSPSPNIDYNFGSISNGITYCINTGTEVDVFQDVELYPNPATTQLTINLNSLINCKIKIINALGELITDKINRNVFDTSNLSEGLYFIIITNNSETIVKKLQIIK